MSELKLSKEQILEVENLVITENSIRRRVIVNPVIELIKEALKRGGCQKILAGQLKISPQYLCDILKGKREVSEKIANKLGFKKVIKWVRV